MSTPNESQPATQPRAARLRRRGLVTIAASVRLEADVYGGRVEYHGKGAGLGAGTGSAFSLLPAQNATGNWIKIVQRVPVRIALQPDELARHPLRVGLSMNVTVDVRDVSGRTLADAPRGRPVMRTAVFDQRDADERVRKIIAANRAVRTMVAAS
jgi:membrane fusion protein (multidrug efflux system)